MIDPKVVPSQTLADDLACLLTEHGWTGVGDAQWTRLREALPAIERLLAAAPKQDAGALTDEEVAALGLCETAFSRKDGAFYDAHIATVCAALRRCYPKAGGG